jgi:hypothetical protein
MRRQKAKGKRQKAKMATTVAATSLFCQWHAPHSQSLRSKPNSLLPFAFCPLPFAFLGVPQ